MEEGDDMLDTNIEELQPPHLVAKTSLMAGPSQEPELHVSIPSLTIDLSMTLAQMYHRTLRLNEAEDQRLTKWAREDGQNRSFGIGSGKGKASVTGHASRSSSSSTSLSGTRLGSTTRKAEGRKPRRDGSLLQSALGKRGRFD